MALPSATRLDRMPLGLRVILVGLAAGVLLWLLLDRYQTQWIEEVFREDLTKRLEERARSDRLRLDQRIRTHFGYIGVLVGQAEFLSQITDDLKNYRTARSGYGGRGAALAAETLAAAPIRRSGRIHRRGYGRPRAKELPPA